MSRPPIGAFIMYGDPPRLAGTGGSDEVTQRAYWEVAVWHKFGPPDAAHTARLARRLYRLARRELQLRPLAARRYVVGSLVCAGSGASVARFAEVAS